MHNQWLFLTLALAAAHTASAAEETSPSQWKGEAELGLVNTSGNTNSDTTNVKARIGKDRERWRHTAELAALKSSDSTGTTAQRLDLKGQSDYKFSKNEYLFGLVTYENDRFSGYDYRFTEVVGYGRRVLDSRDMILDLEAGPGARQSNLDDGGSERELLVRGAAKFAWNITKTSKFSEDLAVEASSDVTISRSVTALSSKINGNLAMRLSYTVKRTSKVPAGIENTDTETAMTLVFSY